MDTKRKQEALGRARALEPCTVKATISFSSASEPGVPLELALPSLRVMQHGQTIGELSSPLELAGLPSRFVQSLRLIPVGSLTSKNMQPAEVQLRFFDFARGAAAALDMCVSVKDYDCISVNNTAMEVRAREVFWLRNCVLRNVIDPTPAEAAMIEQSGLQNIPAHVVTQVIALCLGYMSLRDICAATRVCKAWRAAIDENSGFWNSLMWWDDASLLVAVGNCDEATQAQTLKTKGELGKWMELAEKCGKLCPRLQALAGGEEKEGNLFFFFVL